MKPTFGPLLAILLVGLCGESAFAQEAIDWFRNDRTEKLQDIIQAFRSNYQLVQSQRYAFVCKGNKIAAGESSFQVTDVYFTGLRYPSGTYLFANSWLDENASGAYARERWDQQIFFRGKLYRRWGPFDGDPRDTLSDNKEIVKAQRSFVRFDPIDMSVSMEGQAYTKGPEREADRWLTLGKLVKAEFVEKGDIVHIVESTAQPGKASMQIKVLWSKEMEYYPSRVEYALVTNQGEALIKPVSLVATHWKRLGQAVLPSKMAIIRPRKMREHVQMELSIRYKLQQQLANFPLVDPNMIDWREPLRILFDEDWQRDKSQF